MQDSMRMRVLLWALRMSCRAEPTLLAGGRILALAGRAMELGTTASITMAFSMWMQSTTNGIDNEEDPLLQKVEDELACESQWRMPRERISAL